MNQISAFIKGCYSKSPLVTVFCLGSIIAIIANVILFICTGGTSLYNTLYQDKTDIFMDYFNSIWYAVDSPYSKHHVIYPVLINLIYWMIGSVMLPYTPMVSDQWPYMIRDSYLGLFSYFMFTLIAFYSLHIIFNKMQKNEGCNVNPEIVSAFLLFSYPVIFGIMRGNCIVYALMFVALFLLGYRSENDFIRIMSYLSLAVAAGMKIYPALFGIVLLKNINYKHVLECILIGFVIVLLPMFFIDIGFKGYLDIAFGYVGGIAATCIINIHDVVYAILFLYADSNIINIVSAILTFGIYGLTAYLAVFSKNIKMWELVTLIACCVILGFGTPASYNFIYLIIPLIMFLGSEKFSNRFNVITAILFTLTLCIFPALSYIMRDFMNSIRGVSTIILFIMIAYAVIKRDRNSEIETDADETQ